MKSQKFTILFFILALQLGLFFSVEASVCPDNSFFDKLSSSCKCMTGYIWEGSQCVKLNQYCADTLGDNSKYNSVTEKCECSYGYIAFSGQCVHAKEYCQDVGGAHSIYDSTSKSCKCEYGYLKNSSDYCISQDDYCNEEYGDHSEYNKSSKKCECKAGYKLNNSKCFAIEILSVSQESGFFGDEIKIIGNNLGDLESNFKLYVGDDLIDTSNITEWKQNGITFKIADGLRGGNIILKMSDETSIVGPNLSVSVKTEPVKTESDEESDKVTLNQQINIASQPADNATKTAEDSDKSTGFFSFVSGFLGSVLNGFKSLFSNFVI